MAAQVELSENGNLVNGSNPLSTNPNVSRGTGNVDANTQRIKCLWSNWKLFLRKNGYRNSIYIEEYIYASKSSSKF